MPLYGTIVVIKRNGLDGSKFPLTAKRCLIGSGENCDIRMHLPSAADEHCEIVVTETKNVQLMNKDVNEQTMLGGQKIPFSVAADLKHGDVFTIVDRCFRYESGPRAPRCPGDSEKPEPTVEIRVSNVEEEPYQTLQRDNSDTRNMDKVSPVRKVKKSVDHSPRLVGVSKLYQANKGHKTPRLAGISRLYKVEKMNKTPRLGGIAKLYNGKVSSALKTPKMAGVSKLFRRGTPQKSPRLAGISQLLRERKQQQRSPRLAGISEIFNEEQVRASPRLAGISNLFKNAVERISPDVRGISELFHEQKSQVTPKFAGVPDLFRETKTSQSPRLEGVRQLLRETGPEVSPNLDGVVELFDDSAAPKPSKIRTKRVQANGLEQVAAGRVLRNRKPDLVDASTRDEVAELDAHHQKVTKRRVATGKTTEVVEPDVRSKVAKTRVAANTTTAEVATSDAQPATSKSRAKSVAAKKQPSMDQRQDDADKTERRKRKKPNDEEVVMREPPPGRRLSGRGVLVNSSGSPNPGPDRSPLQNTNKTDQSKRGKREEKPKLATAGGGSKQGRRVKGIEEKSPSPPRRTLRKPQEESVSKTVTKIVNGKSDTANGKMHELTAGNVKQTKAARKQTKKGSDEGNVEKRSEEVKLDKPVRSRKPPAFYCA